MINPQTSTPLWMRFLTISFAILLLLWLSVEDSTENIAVLFAALICTWITTAILLRIKSKTTISNYFYIMAGFLAGAGITPVALLLMIFKTGLHSHSIPDYTNGQILSVIQKTPIWLISGIFIGMGIGMWLKSEQR
jgi:hypothetical protein